MLLGGPGKEPLSNSHFTPSAQQEVDRTARFIHGAIEVDPLASDFEVSLIQAPGIADRLRIPVPALIKLRHEALHLS